MLASLVALRFSAPIGTGFVARSTVAHGGVVLLPPGDVLPASATVTGPPPAPSPGATPDVRT